MSGDLDTLRGAVRMTAEAERMRALIAQGCCPYCGGGPFVVVANHTFMAHGVTARELKLEAGMRLREATCTQAFSDHNRALSQERGFPEAGAKFLGRRSPEQRSEARRRAAEVTKRRMRENPTPRQAEALSEWVAARRAAYAAAIIQCEWCGRDFHSASRSRFCSRSCGAYGREAKKWGLPIIPDLAAARAVNPNGVCECGCGEKTPLASNTRLRCGQRKGEPTRCCPGHRLRPQAAATRSPDPEVRT